MKPCSYKCDDVRKLILAQCQTNKKILKDILESVYFGDLPDIQGQKYAIITHTESEKIDITVLLRGGENLLFYIRKDQDFGKIRVTFVVYNKCYCDGCIEKNIFRWTKEGKIWRIHVFKEYIIPIYIRREGAVPSLTQLSIKANTKEIKCCRPSETRKHQLWLGDGVDPTTSCCGLRNAYTPALFRTETTYPHRENYLRKRNYYTHKWIWGQLDIREQAPYLFIGIKRKELYLFTRYGNIVCVVGYPTDIKKQVKDLLWIIGERDLIFIHKTFTSYKIKVFRDV